jgi:photosystem II stability/assembly factor-like uncharacterized protein
MGLARRGWIRNRRHRRAEIAALAFSLALAASLVVSAPAWSARRWEPVGPEGGTVIAFAAAPGVSTTVYAATPQGGVYRSEDSGSSWSPASGGLPALVLRSIAVDPAAPGTLYLGTAYQGVWTSLDGGRSWRTSVLRLLGDIAALVVDPASHRIYAALLLGSNASPIWTSSDGGASWAPLAAPPLSQLKALALGRGALFAGGYEGVARSTDGGAHWDPVFRGASTRVNALALAGRTVYAAAFFELLRGENLGSRWSASKLEGLDFGFHSLAVIPGKTDTIFASTRGGRVMWNQSEGRRWEQRMHGLPRSPRGRALLALPGAPDSLLAASDGLGVWSTQDAARTWQTSSRGLQALQVTSLLADPLRSAIFYAASPWQNLSRTDDAGRRWIMPTHDGAEIARLLALDPRRPATVYALGTLVPLGPPRLLRSRNGGRAWTDIDPEPGGVPGSFALDPGEPSRLYFADGSDLFRSQDGGEEWRRTRLEGTQIRAIAVAPTGEIYLAGAVAPGVGSAQSGGVLRSLDGGATFASVGAGLPDGPAAIWVGVDPRSPSTLLAQVVGRDGSAPGSPLVRNVFRSIDRGEHWTALAGLSRLQATVTGFVVSGASPQTAWLASAGQGVFESVDGGLAWKPLEPPLLAPVVHGLALVPGFPERLYAASEGGLFELVAE